MFDILRPTMTNQNQKVLHPKTRSEKAQNSYFWSFRNLDIKKSLQHQVKAIYLYFQIQKNYASGHLPLEDCRIRKQVRKIGSDAMKLGCRDFRSKTLRYQNQFFYPVFVNSTVKLCNVMSVAINKVSCDFIFLICCENNQFKAIFQAVYQYAGQVTPQHPQATVNITHECTH